MIKKQIIAMGGGGFSMGEMGCCLASKFIKSGHIVSIVNSRGPTSLKQLTENIGAEAVTVEEVTRNKKVIVVAIPQKSIPDLPKTTKFELSCPPMPHPPGKGQI